MAEPIQRAAGRVPSELGARKGCQEPNPRFRVQHRVTTEAEPVGQLAPQSLAVHSVGVVIGCPSFLAGKVPGRYPAPAEMQFESKHPLVQLIFDAALLTLLYVVAAVFADGMNRVVTPAIKWMHGVWFGIGVIPCLLHLRYCRVVQFDHWDVLAFSPLALALSIVPGIVSWPYDLLAISVVFYVCNLSRSILPSAAPRKHATFPNEVQSRE